MTTLYFIAASICSSTDNDAVTILDIEAGKVYSMIGKASSLWQELLAHPEGVSLDQVVSVLQARDRDVQEEETHEAQNLLSLLHERGLINTRRRTPALFTALVCSWLLRAQVLLICALRSFHLTGLQPFVQLTFIHLVLKTIGFRGVHSLVSKWPVSFQSSIVSIDATRSAINRAVQLFPKQSLCLQRSAAFTCLLRSHGVRAEMVIGCKRLPFKGHAWVEVDGEVINDNPKVQSFYHLVLQRC